MLKVVRIYRNSKRRPSSNRQQTLFWVVLEDNIATLRKSLQKLNVQVRDTVDSDTAVGEHRWSQMLLARIWTKDPAQDSMVEVPMEHLGVLQEASSAHIRVPHGASSASGSSLFEEDLTDQRAAYQSQ